MGPPPIGMETDAAVLILAYIDPSAGGMLMQLLLGGTAGVLVIGRLFWSRIRRLLGRPDPPDGPAPPAR
jgi:predicted membrane metal-binding protein